MSTEHGTRAGRGSVVVHWRHASLGFQACGEMFSGDGITDKPAAVSCPRCIPIVTSPDAFKMAYVEALEIDAEMEDTCADCLESLSDPDVHCAHCGDHIDGDGVCPNCGEGA